jgi:hypothetical protein
MPVLAWRYARYGYTFRRVRMTDGRYAKVDPADYYLVCDMTWYAHGNGWKYYAQHKCQMPDGRCKRIYMHRLIMFGSNPKSEILNTKLFVDHINGDGLDNRRANLRFATASQNGCNKPGLNKSSKYKGVSSTGRKNSWQATININNKHIHLGVFDNEVEAAKVYDEAAKKYHGEFAYLNFPKKKRRGGLRGQN